MSLTDLNYTYGPDGQLTAIVDNLDPSKSKAISYDQLNRLVQVAEGIPATQGGTPIPVEDYAYDEEGNRTASHLSALYSSNDHNQLLEDDTYTYTYDLKGNRTSRTSKTTGVAEIYAYNSENQLVGYTSPTSTASYAYDALGRRVAKATNGIDSNFVYDSWLMASEIGDDVIIEFSGSNLTTRWLHGAKIDEPLAFERYTGTSEANTGVTFSMFSDRMGSIREVVETATNSVSASIEYDSFGARNVVGSIERYGFTGREHDDESGLIYFRARHYDSATGQFLQRDPVGFAAGDFNLYAYVWNDPYNWTDPSGLISAAIENANIDNAEAGFSLPSVGTIGAGALSLATKIRDALRLFDLAKLAVNTTANSGAGAATDTESVPNVVESNSNGAANAEDERRKAEEREKRRRRKEEASRSGDSPALDGAGRPQKQSGDGFRDRENANRGPSGQRPKRDNGSRPRKDTTSPHNDGFGSNPRLR